MERAQGAAWLQALDLAQITISAELDPSGELRPVGKAWEKLLAAAQDTAGLLRVVVVSAQQPDIPPGLDRDDASPLRVILAASIQEAVQKLHRAQWADPAAAALIVLPQRAWRPGISPPGALLRADIEGAVPFHGRRDEIKSVQA